MQRERVQGGDEKGGDEIGPCERTCYLLLYSTGGGVSWGKEGDGTGLRIGTVFWRAMRGSVLRGTWWG